MNYSDIDIRDLGEGVLLDQFDSDVFDSRLNGTLEPYRYGSYFIYEANNSTK